MHITPACTAGSCPAPRTCSDGIGWPPKPAGGGVAANADAGGAVLNLEAPPPVPSAGPSMASPPSDMAARGATAWACGSSWCSLLPSRLLGLLPALSGSEGHPAIGYGLRQCAGRRETERWVAVRRRVEFWPREAQPVIPKAPQGCLTREARLMQQRCQGTARPAGFITRVSRRPVGGVGDRRSWLLHLTFALPALLPGWGPLYTAGQLLEPASACDGRRRCAPTQPNAAAHATCSIRPHARLRLTAAPRAASTFCESVLHCGSCGP